MKRDQGQQLLECLTFPITVHFTHDDLPRLLELRGNLVCGVVKYRGQHVAEATPVRVEVYQHQLVGGCEPRKGTLIT